MHCPRMINRCRRLSDHQSNWSLASESWYVSSSTTVYFERVCWPSLFSSGYTDYPDNRAHLLDVLWHTESPGCNCEGTGLYQYWIFFGRCTDILCIFLFCLILSYLFQCYTINRFPFLHDYFFFLYLNLDEWLFAVFYFLPLFTQEQCINAFYQLR